MGGRGGTSHRASGGGFSFLGERKHAFSLMDSVRMTNPFYSRGREWQINCQRCVFAYELLRRGYDVEAKPVPTDGTFDPLPYRTRSDGWTSLMRGMSKHKYESTSGKTQLQDAIDTMKDWGVGARAIIAVQWKSGGGHVFIAETTSSGSVRFLDPQPGRFDVSHYFTQAKPEWTELLRTDTATPTERLELAVKKKKTR